MSGENNSINQKIATTAVHAGEVHDPSGSHINPIHQIRDSIDELEDVEIFYNGSIRHIENRNVTKDGYNLGLRWQCVEFVKRFYLKFFNHKMPDSYGHAKDFFLIKI